ncbi:hypothetical protein AGDE_09064 [Angomonas deanei]|nr:hypothetical protein AGDE_09064 [Angomonas deanei]|eukprot:EPY31414.1 hypothetical protein AGDE_09064 [Angomonas deanei]
MDAKVAMRDVVCAVNAAQMDSHLLTDLTGEELRSQCAVLSVAVTGHHTENIVWFESSGRIAPEVLKSLMEAAQGGAKQMFTTIREVIKEKS